MSRLSRREFLNVGALAGGAALLAACGPAATQAPAQPTAAPATAAPATGETEAPAEEATEAPALEAPPEEAVTIRLATFDWYSGNPAAPWDAWMQDIAFPKFMEEHPTITPTYEPLGESWEDKILTQMAAGEAPDVIETWSPILETWNDKNQLLDLQPLTDRDFPNADSMWIPDSWNQMLDPFTGRRMGLPLNYDVTSFYYNQTAYEEVGFPAPSVDWTFDDYVQGALAVKKEDANGNPIRWGAGIRGGLWWGWVFHIYAFGGKVVDETRTECLLGQPEALDAVEWLRKGYWDLNCFARGDQLAALVVPGQPGGIEGGLVTAQEGSTEYIGRMEEAAKSFTWKWGQTHYPKGPVARSAQGLDDEYALYAGVAERGTQEAAWTMLKFISAEEWFQEEGVTKVSSRLPCLLTSLAKWPSILRGLKPALNDIHIETIPEAVEMGYLAPAPLFRFQREAQEVLDPVFEGILTTGEMPVSALADAADACTKQQKELMASGGA